MVQDNLLATLTAGNQVRFHMGSANGGEVSYAGNGSATMLSGDLSLKKARLLQLSPERVYRTMTDPLNGWTGTTVDSMVKGPRHLVTVLVVPYRSNLC